MTDSSEYGVQTSNLFDLLSGAEEAIKAKAKPKPKKKKPAQPQAKPAAAPEKKTGIKTST